MQSGAKRTAMPNIRPFPGNVNFSNKLCTICIGALSGRPIIPVDYSRVVAIRGGKQTRFTQPLSIPDLPYIHILMSCQYFKFCVTPEGEATHGRNHLLLIPHWKAEKRTPTDIVLNLSMPYFYMKELIGFNNFIHLSLTVLCWCPTQRNAGKMVFYGFSRSFSIFPLCKFDFLSHHGNRSPETT